MEVINQHIFDNEIAVNFLYGIYSKSIFHEVLILRIRSLTICNQEQIQEAKFLSVSSLFSTHQWSAPKQVLLFVAFLLTIKCLLHFAFITTATTTTTT